MVSKSCDLCNVLFMTDYLCGKGQERRALNSENIAVVTLVVLKIKLVVFKDLFVFVFALADSRVEGGGVKVENATPPAGRRVTNLGKLLQYGHTV